MEGWPSGQWQQTVNLPTNVYVGSNPTPSTIRKHYARRVGTMVKSLKFGVWRRVCAEHQAGVAQW